ncbi:MAG: ABC transporter substrate-binding protein [Thermogemmatispora sp.]|jgi:iron complex transport system substrate-binding protein|uniref:ABC transporter substrate-binding protein n=1 Tax=Thermogemmatispora aurantia TaxID=2045279 RepID=A0A5J4KET4_9CHLR|nr:MULTISPECIES: helical backbone metal receptor [Thermogemmatispora]MBE3565996.1 ABC transporter substrate-binding protein [Thermogemmatispora sp.]GER85040.1 ABC transporter substrate-binding protein [Thermogemmatispora aurantia]
MRIRVISRWFFPYLLVLCFLLLAACGQSQSGGSAAQPSPTPTAVRDIYGTPVVFPKTAPQRLISLVPSMSEILAALHLESRIVAVDYYTDYPTQLTRLPRISDANGDYNVERIVALHPDLVLSSGGLTEKYDAQLTRLGLHVVDLPDNTIALMLAEIQTVGRLTFTESTADALVRQLQQRIAQIRQAVKGTTPPTVMLEADDSTPGKPYVFGGGTFGDELLQDANAINVFHNNTSNGGYPQVTDEAVIRANPQYIILTEDPRYGGDPQLVYRRPNWGQITALKLHHVYHLNTDLMQRPGPRLVDGLQCLAQLLHPAVFSGSLPAYCQ